jgi:hypothetical protein
MSWNPDIPAAFLILASVLALYVIDLPAWWHGRKFYSAERRKLQNVSKWWDQRAREMQ